MQVTLQEMHLFCADLSKTCTFLMQIGYIQSSIFRYRCGGVRQMTRESRGNHAGITRESRGNHAETTAKIKCKGTTFF